MSRPRGLERLAGAACLVAAGVHGALAPTHFTEWWGYGVFFLVAATCQTLLGLALALRAFEAPTDRTMRRLYAAGAVGNALLLAMYVVSRTVGVPFFGPDAGAVEGIDPLDIVATAAEILAIVVLARLSRSLPTVSEQAAFSSP